MGVKSRMSIQTQNVEEQITPHLVNQERLRRKRRIRGETIAGYLFLAPNILGFLAFTAIPVVSSLILSFFHWEMVRAPSFAGLDNFYTLFLNDPNFIQVVKNTIYYVGVYVPLNMVISLAFALWICTITRGSAIFRTIFFLPVLAPTVAVAFIWKFMYEPDHGLVNMVLGWVGIHGPNWLGDPHFAMLGIIFMSLWKGFGYNMVIFIAGLQGIPRTLYEAAAIDGANSWHRFWKITLPMLSPSMFFAVVMTLITSFQVFDQALVMTEGGPAGATNTIVMYIYQNGFQYFKMGYAAAIAWVLFAVVFIITMIQMVIQKKWVNYE
jgi:multiple sugar transport system permease protein